SGLFENHVSLPCFYVIVNPFESPEPDQFQSPGIVFKMGNEPSGTAGAGYLLPGHYAGQLDIMHSGHDLGYLIKPGFVYVPERVMLKQILPGKNRQFLFQYIRSGRPYAFQILDWCKQDVGSHNLNAAVFLILTNYPS